MKLRRLARLCIHDQLAEHWSGEMPVGHSYCPGGVFLPDDLFDHLQDQLEDVYCIRLQELGVHKRGRCQSFAAEAVGVFRVALGERPVWGPDHPSYDEMGQ